MLRGNLPISLLKTFAFPMPLIDEANFIKLQQSRLDKPINCEVGLDRMSEERLTRKRFNARNTEINRCYARIMVRGEWGARCGDGGHQTERKRERERVMTGSYKSQNAC
ncbi:hypothetical protein Tcan_00641, partial [Toxocara canis]